MDTRQFKRLPVEIECEVVLEGAKGFGIVAVNEFIAQMLDIASGGLCLLSPYFLPKGISAQIKIEGRFFGVEAPLVFTAQVVYCKSAPSSKYRCGFKYKDISDAVSGLIKCYVDEH